MGVARRGLSVSSLLHSSFNLFLVSKFFFCFVFLVVPRSLCFLLMLESTVHVFLLCLPVSLCVGDVLFQMAEVHRQIQVQLEEMVCILSSKGF